MARTDIHRPTALIPEDYDFRGVIDLQAGDLDLYARSAASALRHQLFTVEGRNHASVHCHGQCDHCGASIRYAAYMVHRPTGKIITVGETCLDNRFERSSAEFHALRKAAELDRAEQRIRKAREAFLAANPSMAVLVDLPENAHHILHDLAGKLRRYGSLSERQVMLAHKLLRESEQRNQEQAREVATVPIPDAMIGKVTIEAVVIGTKWQDGQYGSQFKALLTVQVNGGQFKVWSTVPQAQRSGENLKGLKVRWTGTLTRSDRDPAFGILKRPTVAK
jgi:hypothetical protein